MEERELKSLEMVYSKKGFGMTVIYGRRRVGKSTLKGIYETLISRSRLIPGKYNMF